MMMMQISSKKKEDLETRLHDAKEIIEEALECLAELGSAMGEKRAWRIEEDDRYPMGGYNERMGERYPASGYGDRYQDEREYSGMGMRRGRSARTGRYMSM